MHPPVPGAAFVVAGAAAAEPQVPSVQVAVVVALGVPTAGVQLSGLHVPATEAPLALVAPAAEEALALQSAVHAALPLSTLQEEESDGSVMPTDRAIAGRAVPRAAPITSAVTNAAIVCLRFIASSLRAAALPLVRCMRAYAAVVKIV